MSHDILVAIEKLRDTVATHSALIAQDNTIKVWEHDGMCYIRTGGITLLLPRHILDVIRKHPVFTYK